MKTLLALLLLTASIATAQDTAYCGRATRAMRAWRQTTIVAIRPNPATHSVGVILDVGEPGVIRFNWYNSVGLSVRPSSRWVDRGQWLIVMDCYLLPRGRYYITAEHEATGRIAGKWIVWLR